MDLNDFSDKAPKKLKDLNNLEQVVLSNTEVTDIGLTYLRDKKKIVHLDLDKLKGIMGASLDLLEGFPSLERIGLADLQRLIDRAVHMKKLLCGERSDA